MHQASTAEAYLDIRDLRGRAGDDTALRFVLRPGHPDSRNRTETREIVLEFKRIGIAGLAFYDYDHLRRAGLAPVNAAFDTLDSA